MSDEIKAVGTVGSPSTTRRVTVDILEEAESAPLHGALVHLSHPLDDRYLIALGTVTEIRTANRWHEDPNMRGVLKRYGSLPHLSAVGDVRTAEVSVQAAYVAEAADGSGSEPPTESGGALSMSPTTGASVRRVTDEFLTTLLRRHAGEIIYLGHIYRSDVRMPLVIRHFGRTEGGAGEAYHSGIFGMTGSGKSALAAYVIAAMLRHPEMGVFIIDPQGQFSSEEGLPFSLQEWAERLGRPVRVYRISRDLRLRRDAFLLADLLGLTRFFRDVLTLRGEDARESAISEFTRIMQGIARWDEQPADDVLRAAVTTLLSDQAALTRIYASAQPRARLAGALQSILSDAAQFEIAAALFRPLHSLFSPRDLGGNPRRSLWSVLEEALDVGQSARPLVIIDFSGEGEAGELLETSRVKARILRSVCSRLNQVAEGRYREGGDVNAAVVFDEAHRFASDQSEDSEVAELSRSLVDYVRTTRKYGLGWLFVTQEIGSLRRSIYSQLRVRAFGYGLVSGSELQRLRETVGDDAALVLYRSFVDPQAIDPAAYPFMITGPVSPLSFTGAPVFLSVYTSFGDFSAANGL